MSYDKKYPKIPIESDCPEELEYIHYPSIEMVSVWSDGEEWWVLPTEDFEKEFGIDPLNDRNAEWADERQTSFGIVRSYDDRPIFE